MQCGSSPPCDEVLSKKKKLVEIVIKFVVFFCYIIGFFCSIDSLDASFALN
jgi:hypothetical protein